MVYGFFFFNQLLKCSIIKALKNTLKFPDWLWCGAWAHHVQHQGTGAQQVGLCPRAEDRDLKMTYLGVFHGVMVEDFPENHLWMLCSLMLVWASLPPSRGV